MIFFILPNPNVYFYFDFLVNRAVEIHIFRTFPLCSHYRMFAFVFVGIVGMKMTISKALYGSDYPAILSASENAQCSLFSFHYMWFTCSFVTFLHAKILKTFQ